MTAERRASRRWILNLLLGGFVAGSGCTGDSDSSSAETSQRAALTTAGASTTETATETSTATTTTAETTDSTTTGTTTRTSRALTYENLELSDRPILGDRNAPVTLVYWGDYRCPACQYFDLKTMPKIEERLVVPGKLRVIYKPVPLFGEQSKLVARASHCVWNRVKDDDSEAFWNWHERTLKTGDESSGGWADRETVVELANRTDGVSGDELATCLRSGRYGDRVSADFDEAKDWDLEGTPHFLIFGDSPEDGGAYTAVPSYDWFAESVEFYR